jgi:hypothetical protein
MPPSQRTPKFPWALFIVAVLVAAWWGYTHRTRDEVTTSQIVPAPARELSSLPIARRSPARSAPSAPGVPALQPVEAASATLHPLDEPDPERDADPALVERRNAEESRLHAIQHGPEP